MSSVRKVASKAAVKAKPKSKVTKKEVPKKPVKAQEPDPSDEVFSVMDNILDVDTEFDDTFDEPSTTDKGGLITLTESVPRPQVDVSAIIPYRNPDETALYTSPDYDIQQCALYIEYMLGRTADIVTDNKILSLLNNLSVATSPFWNEFAWSKDIISYKLNQRNFPIFQITEKETTTEVDPDEVKNELLSAPRPADSELDSDELSELPDDGGERTSNLISLTTPVQPKSAPKLAPTKVKKAVKAPIKAPIKTALKKTAKKVSEESEEPDDEDVSSESSQKPKPKKWVPRSDDKTRYIKKPGSIPPKEASKETEATIRKKYDLGRPGSLQQTLDMTYVDEGVTVTDSGVRQYNVLPQEKYTSTINHDTIRHIFEMCNSRRAYPIMLSLFCRLCVSREFCHLVFNTHIMSMMFALGTPFHEPEYLEIIHHFMFFGFYLLYKEECTIKSMANPTHRCILDLETVQHMPVYNGALSENPYIPLTLSAKYLYAEDVPNEKYIFKPLRVPNSERGVYTVHSTQARFDVFTDGVFRGLNWDKLSMTGSVMPACVIRNPLEKLFGINLPMNQDLNNPDAAKTYWNDNKNALRNYFDEYYPSKNILDPSYLSAGSEEGDESSNNQTIPTEKLSDIDIIVDFGDDQDFDRKVLEVFEVVKANVIRNNQEDPVRFPSVEVKLLKITTPMSYKYYIVGPGLHKNIELFRIFVHPLGCVSRFHFPCVRGTYNGESIKMFPSMVSAAFTGTLLEYKWMSSAKNTKDLVCKYYTRGFSLILNAVEHESMWEHIQSESARWGYLMAANDNERSITVSNPIFKPRQAMSGIYHGLENFRLKPAPIYKHIVPMIGFDKYWVSNEKRAAYGFSLDYRFPAGHIQPPGLWKLGPYIEKLQQSGKYGSI